MTDDQLLDWHLSYLKTQLTPPTTYGWWPHVEARAKELVADPALTQLPALVQSEYERIRSESQSSRKHGPKPKSTNQPKEKADGRD